MTCILIVQNAETVKMLSLTKQEHDDVQRANSQLESEVANLRLEKSSTVSTERSSVFVNGNRPGC